MSGSALGDVPDALVGVIVETARGILRERAPDALTPALRPLARVDQRAAASATVRRQFVAALERDDDLRREVAAAVVARGDAARLLDGFTRASAIAVVA